jgi:D-alanyl-D-alanine carboxypeptidase/D-alanyl-D-alanine-endopeptidase (penicillin-binding protein 4)
VNQPARTPAPRFSRRAAVRGAGGMGVAFTAGAVRPGAAGAADATPVAGGSLPAEITAVMRGPRYASYTRWGIYVADRETGQAVYDHASNWRFIPGSTTKLFPAAAALVTYGPDFRFQTPVYANGAIVDGALDGDLILVASGDITMGGRDQPDGTLAYGNIDHTDTNAVSGATLTAPDPLAGLDKLAAQVAAAGISRASDVIIDARLWDQLPKDDYVLSPIMINDNVVDLTVTATSPGKQATVTSRPVTAFFDLRSDVTTVDANQDAELTLTSPAANQLVLTGQIPQGIAPVLVTAQVDDPPAFARTLFIEALRRQGVTVAAEAVGPNPTDRLPASDAYTAHDRVAVLTSLPFAEVIKIILKVSLNRGADTLVFLLAVHEGKRTFEDGLMAIGAFLGALRVEATAISLADGRGNARADLFSPRAVAALLRSMAGRPEFAPYLAAFPILGVDGTEWKALPESSPARGHIVAKTGTTIDGDLMNSQYLLQGRAAAGYMTGRSGRELVWAVYVNDVSAATVDDLLAIDADIGEIAATIYALN